MLPDRRNNKVVSKALLEFIFLQTPQWMLEDTTLQTQLQHFQQVTPSLPLSTKGKKNKAKTENHSFFPCNTLTSLMVSGAQEGNNRWFFYSAHEQRGDKQALGTTWGRGRALGWEERAGAGFLPTTSLPSGRGRLRMREDMVCPGRRKAEFHFAVLISLGTGGNYSSLRQSKSTENEF